MAVDYRDYISDEQYQVFRDVVGVAMTVYNEYKSGLLESAYEAAMEYVLRQMNFNVERQVFLPIFWKSVKLEQTYKMDLVVNHRMIVELKAIKYINLEQRSQLWNYMNLTHQPYGLLINFSPNGVYSEWYYRDPITTEILRFN